MKFAKGEKVVVEGKVGFVCAVDDTNKKELLYKVVGSKQNKNSTCYGWYLPNEIEKAA